jgi:hypothetical protein
VGNAAARIVDTLTVQDAARIAHERVSACACEWTMDAGSFLHASATAVVESGCNDLMIAQSPCLLECGSEGSSNWTACSAVGCSVEDLTQS